MFWLSMTDIERIHIVEAYTFELGKVFEQAIKERTLGVLAHGSTASCANWSRPGSGCPPPRASRRRRRAVRGAVADPSEPGPIAGQGRRRRRRSRGRPVRGQQTP